MNYPWSKAFLRTCPRNFLKVRLCNVLLSSCQSSHPPLAHHHPGHYQCFHGVNSHSWKGSCEMKGNFVVKTVRTPRGIIVLIATIATLLAVLPIRTFASMGSTTFASSVIETPTQSTPWVVAFDKSVHIWVAEPGSHPTPLFQTAFPSSTREHHTANPHPH